MTYNPYVAAVIALTTAIANLVFGQADTPVQQEAPSVVYSESVQPDEKDSDITSESFSIKKFSIIRPTEEMLLEMEPTTAIETDEETKEQSAPDTNNRFEEANVVNCLTQEDIEATTAEVSIGEEKASPISYTENDLFYLAAVVCREAGGASEEIQLLVANVVINRVNHSIYPNTIYEVLTQYMQYGTMWRDGISFPGWADETVKEQCYSVAKRILDGERVCPSNVLFQAEFAQGSAVFKQFDGYYFCFYESMEGV